MCLNKKPEDFLPPSDETGSDQSYITEELAYWTFVENSNDFEADLKEYAREQIKLMQAELSKYQQKFLVKKFG